MAIRLFVWYNSYQFFLNLIASRHFRKMEEVFNGYVTNPNPTPTLTPNSNQIDLKKSKKKQL